MSDSEKHFEFAVNLARDALKSLLLVNGGAATALIALTDKTNGSKDYSGAIILFGVGAVFSVVSTCFGYFSQLNYANHRMEMEDDQNATRSHTLHRRWQLGPTPNKNIVG
jgi:hypothetical protein